MDNKLSELSKPTALRNKHTGRTFNATENTEPQIYESLDSQEYVSALLADNEAKERRIAELKEREKRVVALAGGNADLWETMAARLEAAEDKLATPVRLTDERTLWAGEDDYDTGHVKGWNANRIEQAALLKKQGFTVVEGE